jgi:hypothetical protein
MNLLLETDYVLNDTYLWDERVPENGAHPLPAGAGLSHAAVKIPG